MLWGYSAPVGDGGQEKVSNGSDPQVWGRSSTAAVLDHVWGLENFRADDVIGALGLTRSSALQAVDSLIELGLAHETGPNTTATARKGRPARSFGFRADAGAILGIDAGGRAMTAIVADLTGTPLARAHLALPLGSDALPIDQAMRRESVLSVADEALARAGLRRADVVAVGVGVPAPVNALGESPVDSTGFWPGMNADLHTNLSEVFPAVRLENDAALAAMAERGTGIAIGCDNLVALLSEGGLGAGVFLDGRLVRGRHGGVGELASLDHVDGVETATGLGVRIEAWARQRIATGLPDSHPWTRLDPESPSAADVLASAQIGDPVSEPLLRQISSVIARTCTVLRNFYDPEVLVVCGSHARALEPVLRLVRETLAVDSELPAPRLMASELGDEVVCLGAVTAARLEARRVALPLFAARAKSRPA